jgi:hypothetical protein
VTLALFGMHCAKFVGELNVNGWPKLILFMVTLMLTMLSCIVDSAMHHPSNNNNYYNNNNNINKNNNSSNKTQITTTFY